MVEPYNAAVPTKRFEIDRTSAVPVYVQLQEQIRLLVHRGVLTPGDAMPTVRALAVELGINANTVTRVYRELQQQGFLRLERGVGTFVAVPPRDPSLGEDDYRRLETQVRALVEMARSKGLARRELTQLLETLWKETSS